VNLSSSLIGFCPGFPCFRKGLALLDGFPGLFARDFPAAGFLVDLTRASPPEASCC